MTSIRAIREGETVPKKAQKIDKRRLARPWDGTIACAVIVLMGLLTPAEVRADAYTYDQLGRVTTASYPSGVCIKYVYDANGNRTAITTISTTPGSPAWGSGVWGCIQWTP